ncbi:cobalamin biosynthesis protein [Halobacteria archaeon HArc-gm2]|nr:cobalamin biosynthesis protein [Halobacteria archaeon HArc-gm2]
MSIQSGTPKDLLAAHPETAYFWGRVAADGECEDGCVTVRTNDETAAHRLAAIAGADQIDRRILEREYAHDTAITRKEDEYVVQVLGDLADRAGAALGLPLEGQPGGYRFDVFADHDRQLLRGLLEGCGTVCFKSDDEAVGISASEASRGSTEQGSVVVSFVHDDERLLRAVQSVLDRIPVDAPHDDLADASSGYWFGVDDDSVPALGEWVYEGTDESGLFAPPRRRKLRKSLDRIER